MSRIAQIGIAIGILGMMLTLMGLFPGMTGLPPTPGVGTLQMFTILIGFSLLILGALIYVKFAFYVGQRSNLFQQIGTRLAMTGLVLAALSGLGDSLGYGSHSAAFTDTPLVGPLQAAGIIVSFMMSCIGVLIYAVAGMPDKNGDDTSTNPSSDL